MKSRTLSTCQIPHLVTYSTVIFWLWTTVALGQSITNIIPQDRLIHWAPGVPGGIPNRTTVCATLSPGTTAAQINSAIDSCNNGVVLLSAGTYSLSGAIFLDKSGVTLRGAGPTQTILRKASGMIAMGDSASIGASVSITSGSTQGSNQVTVSSTSGLAAGDFIAIRQNNPSYVTANGANGICDWCAADDPGQAMVQINKILSINGFVLTLEQPLYIDFVNSPHFKKLSGMTSHVGVENLKVESTSAGSEQGNIDVDGCAYCWVKNVVSEKAQKAHIWVDTSYAFELRESVIRDGHTFGSDRAYGIRINNWNSAHLVEDNVFERLRHAVVFEGGGSGVVNPNNYLKDPHTNDASFLGEEMIFHGAHPFMNLWEGNSGTTISPDNVWGSNSHSIYFRNSVSGTKPENHAWGWLIDINYNSLYHSFVGNVLGHPGIQSNSNWVYEASCNTGADGFAIWRWGCLDLLEGPANSAVRQTAVVHGNYDYKRNQFDWEPGKSQNLPASLLYSSKPAWFGSAPWPPIGPDPTHPSVLLTGTIPAKVRYEGGADIVPPTVSITAPTQGSTVAGAVMVSANAADNVGVVGVQFKLNDTNLGAEDTSVPYQMNWDTRNYTNSSYTWTATARDISGNTATSAPIMVTVSNTSMDTTAPTVSITVPANNAIVSGNAVTVTAQATDDVAVVGVQFRLDGIDLSTEDTIAPYSIVVDTTKISNGPHALSAVARDAAGNRTTSSSITMNVNNPVPDQTPPVVNITAPGTGSAVFRNSTVTIRATASDNIRVNKVEFYINGVLVRTDMSSPYTYRWDVPRVRGQSYRLQAKAYDTAGNTGESSIVTVISR